MKIETTLYLGERKVTEQDGCPICGMPFSRHLEDDPEDCTGFCGLNHIEFECGTVYTYDHKGTLQVTTACARIRAREDAGYL